MQGGREMLTGFQLIKFPAFCEPEGLLPHSQVRRHNCKTPIMLNKWQYESQHILESVHPSTGMMQEECIKLNVWSSVSQPIFHG
jgi:hypothetical protein